MATTDSTDITPPDDEKTDTTMKKKRSKSAFDTARGSFYKFDPDELVIIGADTAHKSKEEHGLWDKRAKEPLETEFVENIAAKGIDTPILVAKLDLGDGPVPVVVAGRRRTRGARAANKGRANAAGRVVVPAMIVQGTMLELMAMMITENAGRKDLDMLDKAAEAKAMLAAGGTKEDVALAFTVSTKQVENWLALAGATRPVQEAVLAGRVPATAATKIARLGTPEAQKEALEEALAAGKVTTQTARAAVAKRKQNGKNDEHENGLGITSRKDQKKILTWLGSGEQSERSVYWDGVADAFKIILGEKGADARIKKAVKRALKAAA